MFKVAWFARFREGISKEEGRRYWVEQHAALARATTIERYVQSHVTGPVPALTGVAEEETFFDGYSLGWWSDRGAFEATMASPEWQLVAADGPNVFDVDWLAGMSAEVQGRLDLPLQGGHRDGRRPRALGERARPDLQGARHRPLRAEPRCRAGRRGRRDAGLRRLLRVLVP
jgi:hypothetical protein